jgi:hypothetical protein
MDLGPVFVVGCSFNYWEGLLQEVLCSLTCENTASRNLPRRSQKVSQMAFLVSTFCQEMGILEANFLFVLLGSPRKTTSSQKHCVPEASWKVLEGFPEGIPEGQLKEQCDIRVFSNIYIYMADFIWHW